MIALAHSLPLSLAEKIAYLVAERGWNQEDFARLANLNRQTVREILQGQGPRRMRNATVAACAQALGLSVGELRDAPLEYLLRATRPPGPAEEGASLRRLYEEATQPELGAWLERNAKRAAKLTTEEIDELLSLQGTGGPMTSYGVEHFVALIERRREIVRMVYDVANTEYIDLLDQLVRLLHEKVQPYARRA